VISGLHAQSPVATRAASVWQQSGAQHLRLAIQTHKGVDHRRPAGVIDRLRLRSVHARCIPQREGFPSPIATLPVGCDPRRSDGATARNQAAHRMNTSRRSPRPGGCARPSGVDLAKIGLQTRRDGDLDCLTTPASSRVTGPSRRTSSTVSRHMVTRFSWRAQRHTEHHDAAMMRARLGCWAAMVALAALIAGGRDLDRQHAA
jgi:hypothetical protein